MDRLVKCVVEYRKRGYSLQEIAWVCKCSVRNVRKILQQHGDPLRECRPKHRFKQLTLFGTVAWVE